MRTAEEARSDLNAFLKHLRFAIEEANAAGKARLGVLSVRPDGGGKIECQFDCGFVDDVALLLGFAPLSDADRKECRDQQLLHKLGLK